MERKNKKQHVNLTCFGCGLPFVKEKKEYDRWIRRNRATFYCTISCAAKYDQLDEFSRFKLMFNRSKKNAKRKNVKFDLTLSYMKELWEKQKGICPYTHIRMELSRGKNPQQASLDRIDPSLGYIQNNVEFVCLFINYGKNGFSQEQTINFLKSVSIG